MYVWVICGYMQDLMHCTWEIICIYLFVLVCITQVKGVIILTYFDWRFARLIAPVVTTTSITLSSNKLQNGDILVPSKPGPVGKWMLKWR